MNVERTDRRDFWYSQEHRKWGGMLNMADIDSVWCEFADYGGKVLALVETKFRPYGRAWLPPSRDDAKCKSMRRLADAVGAAFFVVGYCPVDYTFIVDPWNDRARGLFSYPDLLTGERYVEKLWHLRGLPLPPSIRAYLQGQQATVLLHR